MLAIVPVKGRDGMSRLAGFLAPNERAVLVEAMLADVLAACGRASAVHDILVVTPDDAAVPDGASVLIDDGRGHAEAVARALGDPRAESGALVVMGDCPLATAEALDRLAGSADPIALAPAQDGGMNALALRTPDAVEPVFGVPGSAAATVERARAAGLEPAVVDDPALAFDIDNPADVWKLREGAPATRTHDVLTTILPPTGGLL